MIHRDKFNRYGISQKLENSQICYIVPSVFFEEIIKEGTREERKIALNSYGLSKRVRGYRRAISSMRGLLLSSGTIEKHRTIYDMNHYDDEYLLPGTRVRDESEGESIDEEVNNAYTNTGLTFDFYKELFKRNSIDDSGAILISSVNYGNDFDNALWNGRQMVFGNGGGVLINKGSLSSSLSIIAHEITHGVTNYTADLVYRGESGGLNESFSDIFGITCEQWAKRQKVTDSKWLMGEGIMKQGEALRDMKGEQQANPWDKSIFSYKKYRKGIDVHFSSGIPNKAFYVTAKEIGGYSWEKAGMIWYIVLTQGWLSRHGPRINGTFGRSFQEAADSTFTVAGQLYGQGSDEQNAVREGWKSVDIVPTIVDKPSILDLPAFGDFL